jgi:formimidoylglutamate deiminase
MNSSQPSALSPQPSSYFAELVLLPDGWAKKVRLEVTQGVITRVTPNSSPENAEHLRGAVLPGMINLHSHAFQRALSGLSEHTVGSEDTFWTWRESMYALAGAFTPEIQLVVARQLYIEMLKAGYTSVAEFHYLHQPDPLAMSESLLEAACQSGIHLLLLPSLYQHGGIGEKPLAFGQEKFYLPTSDYLNLFSRLKTSVQNERNLELGIAPHSLRAVSPQTLQELSQAVTDVPIHIHASEQMKEVAASLEYFKARPVEYLLDNFNVNEQWCLIHCTHTTTNELERLAKSGATVGLCPTTEGNLGDGFFNLSEYLRFHGHFGIGTDSNTSISPVEELRWLEYTQRLQQQKRNIVAGEFGSSGFNLYTTVLEGGRRAFASNIGRLEVGAKANLLVLDTEHPNLVGHSERTLLDAFVFSGNSNLVQDVMVNGIWVVQNRHHRLEEATKLEFSKVIRDLRQRVSERGLHG